MISSILTTVIVPAIMGVLAWFGANWVGKPILDTRQARIKALQAAEQNAYVGGAASAARVKEARAALRDAAATLRSISRGHSWQVRLYCQLFHYDLEAAASALIRLHNMTGDFGYDEKAHELEHNTIYVFLGAHGRLTAERINEIKMRVERNRQLEKTEL